MNKLSKEKRDQVILVILVTLLLCCGVWFGLVAFQNEALENLGKSKETAKNKLKQVQVSIRNSEQIESNLAEGAKRITELEAAMAPPSDQLSWIVETIRRFKLGYKVEIPSFSQVEVKDMAMLPKYPYQQATLALGGTAYYHDLGKFIADFENQFPYFRIINVNIEPATVMNATDKEKLSFKMDIVTLVRPGGAS